VAQHQGRALHISTLCTQDQLYASENRDIDVDPAQDSATYMPTEPLDIPPRAD